MYLSIRDLIFLVLIKRKLIFRSFNLIEYLFTILYFLFFFKKRTMLICCHCSHGAERVDMGLLSSI